MKKIILITLYILFHIFILREIRTTIFSLQINDELIDQVEKSEFLSFHKLDTRLVYFEYKSPDFQKYLHYKVPFGSFFFIAMIGLIAIGAQKNFYLGIITIHASVMIITGIVFLFDINAHYWLLIVTDLLSRYIIPLSSIGIIPLALINNRKNGLFYSKDDTST